MRRWLFALMIVSLVGPAMGRGIERYLDDQTLGIIRWRVDPARIEASWTWLLQTLNESVREPELRDHMLAKMMILADAEGLRKLNDQLVEAGMKELWIVVPDVAGPFGEPSGAFMLVLGAAEKREPIARALVDMMRWLRMLEGGDALIEDPQILDQMMQNMFPHQGDLILCDSESFETIRRLKPAARPDLLELLR